MTNLIPLKIFFKNEYSELENIKNELSIFRICTSVEYGNDGIRVFYEEAQYPEKFLPFPEALQAVNLAKRALINSGVFFSLKSFIKCYNTICYDRISPILYKDEFCSPVYRETKRFIHTILVNLGISEEESFKASEIIAAIVEFDDAYRYRFQDVISETSKYKIISSPIREIERLFRIFLAREKCDRISEKASSLSYLRYFLLIPRFKNAFKEAILESNFYNFQYDEQDRYWTSIREGYNFLGKTFKQRIEMYPQRPKMIKNE